MRGLAKGDILEIDGKQLVVKRVRTIGNAGQLGEAKLRGPVRKITLYVGLNRGRSEGDCADDPTKYSGKNIVDAFLALRRKQVEADDVGATVLSAQGVYEDEPEETRVFELVYHTNEREPTFARFKDNVLEIGEDFARLFCQRSVLAVVKDGASEDEWDLTP